MKKRYYLLFTVVLSLFSAYHIFTTTDLFVPKQKEITKPKELFRQMFSEITKMKNKSDTIYFVIYDIHGICGNNPKPYLSEFQRKLEQINYNKQNPFFINIDKSIDESNFIDTKVIISGITGGCPGSNNCFRSGVTNFDINSKKGIIIYRQNYKIVNENTVEIFITANFEEKMKLLMKYKNGKWTSLLLT